MNRKILLLTVFTLITLLVFPQEKKNPDFKFPASGGYVNDFESIFTRKQAKSLEKMIQKHQHKTTNQITIVTVDSIQPYTSVQKYTLDLFNEWGVGLKDKNNGIVILFGKKIRQISITVGRGLESKLSNEECQQIINNIIVPEFKKGDYYNGVKMGLEAVMKEIQ
jgi:uncharacterized protein